MVISSPLASDPILCIPASYIQGKSLNHYFHGIDSFQQDENIYTVSGFYNFNVVCQYTLFR